MMEHCDKHKDYSFEIEKLLHEYFHNHHDEHCDNFIEKIKDLLTNIKWGYLSGDIDNQPDLSNKLIDAKNHAYWGKIEGSLTHQQDLMNYINSKLSTWEQITLGNPENNNKLNIYVDDKIKNAILNSDWFKNFIISIIKEKLSDPAFMSEIMLVWLRNDDIKKNLESLIRNIIGLPVEDCDCTK